MNGGKRGAMGIIIKQKIDDMREVQGLRVIKELNTLQDRLDSRDGKGRAEVKVGALDAERDAWTPEMRECLQVGETLPGHYAHSFALHQPELDFCYPATVSFPNFTEDGSFLFNGCRLDNCTEVPTWMEASMDPEPHTGE